MPTEPRSSCWSGTPPPPPSSELEVTTTCPREPATQPCGDGVPASSSGDGATITYRPTLPRAATALPDPLPIPGYEILSVLGRGGMGVVYLARQSKLQRLVAVKMIRAGQLASAHEVQRFYQEAESAARLDHPGIVPIFEVGEVAGQHYFSLGYVEGGPLSARVKEGPLPAREAAGLVRQVATAVAYAHRHGVIHRDLKPANILLDASGSPRVTDFGLAKQVEHDSGLTASGQVVGTPSYMPPEQAAGRGESVRAAADIYSLGAILYCLLTGRPPFQAASVMETLKQVMEREPVPPRQLNSAVPRDLETICLKCLRKEADRRYGSAQALAEDLGRFSAGEPIHARPVGRIERTSSWCRRNPVVAVLTGAVAFLLVAGTTVSIALAVEANWAKGVALAEKARADEQADAAWATQYVAHMNLMAGDWESGNIGRIRDTLQVYREPLQGRKDVRGWEWYTSRG